MTDSIRIDTGAKRIIVNDDPARVIVFNPSDVAFAERFYELIQDFDAKQAEYQARAEALDADPTNVAAGLAFLREICEFMRASIDRLFGPGTSQAAFSDALSLDMFEQFFDGVTPFILAARSEKVAQYTAAKKRRIMK